jgi:hypothetical protein
MNLAVEEQDLPSLRTRHRMLLMPATTAPSDRRSRPGPTGDHFNSTREGAASARPESFLRQVSVRRKLKKKRSAPQVQVQIQTYPQSQAVPPLVQHPLDTQWWRDGGDGAKPIETHLSRMTAEHKPIEKKQGKAKTRWWFRRRG